MKDQSKKLTEDLAVVHSNAERNYMIQQLGEGAANSFLETGGQAKEVKIGDKGATSQGKTEMGRKGHRAKRGRKGKKALKGRSSFAETFRKMRTKRGKMKGKKDGKTGSASRDGGKSFLEAATTEGEKSKEGRKVEKGPVSASGVVDGKWKSESDKGDKTEQKPQGMTKHKYLFRNDDGRRLTDEEKAKRLEELLEQQEK